MKKRIAAALLSGIMVITGISACAGDNSPSTDSSQTPSATAQTTTTTAQATTTTAQTTAQTTVTTTEAATTVTAAPESTPAPATDAPETEAPKTEAHTTTTEKKPETTTTKATTTTTAVQPDPVTPTGDSVAFSQNLMPGWNLGNQLEANSGGTPSETAWGNPVITEKLIKQVKAQGFKSVRIPVSYLSKIGAGPNYTIDSKWLDRVQEVVDMCIDNGLYAIINIHGDGYYSISGGWLLCADSDQKTIKAKYKKVWEQIAARFKSYDEHLVFESMNEEFDGTYGNPSVEAYNNINDYNQIFVDTVRAAGGKNADRYLLVPGWNTDINFTTGDIDASYELEAKFVIPNDSKGRIMISVHYYAPWEFCGSEEQKTDVIFRWGDTLKGQVKPRQNESLVDKQFDKLYNAYISKGYGVVIGEYGSIDKTFKDARNTTYRAYFAEYVNYAAHKRNIVTVYWDNGWNGKYGFGLFDRKNCTVTQPEIIKGIISGAKATKAPTAPTV